MPPLERTNVALAPYTTMRVGGPATCFVETQTPLELANAVREANGAGMPLLVLGEGSNLLIGDGGFNGYVAHSVGGSIELDDEFSNGDRVALKVGCGARWDDVVAWAVEQGLGGIETLSGIPGQIGSAVMQNLGAYGQEIGQTLIGATLLDRLNNSVRFWDAAELELRYRSSMLRASLENGGWGPSPRWIVLEALIGLRCCPESEVAHPQLAKALGCEVGAHMPLDALRDAVLNVRATKAMVRDEDPLGANPDYDRWSSGSFFTNPVLSVEAATQLPEDAPRYPTGDPATVKTSAAWLIEHAGFGRGFGLAGDSSRATLSTKHTLALTNRGSARASDIVELARAVRAGVEERYGIRLVPESVLVGVEL